MKFIIPILFAAVIVGVPVAQADNHGFIVAPAWSIPANGTFAIPRAKTHSAWYRVCVAPNATTVSVKSLDSVGNTLVTGTVQPGLCFDAPGFRVFIKGESSASSGRYMFLGSAL